MLKTHNRQSTSGMGCGTTGISGTQDCHGSTRWHRQSLASAKGCASHRESAAPFHAATLHCVTGCAVGWVAPLIPPSAHATEAPVGHRPPWTQG
ncbi:MAG: hypothetical protein SPL78_08870 [Bacteroidales bacterium]|nr:hypothetical protein [Bacteroidales bacterium]